MTLPGTPLIPYGDEIGMGDDLSLPQRESVRTPMQWSEARNAGFSDAPEDRLAHPVIDSGEFRYERVNVELERSQPDSLLSWIRRAVDIRRRCIALGPGRRPVVDGGDPAVVAVVCAQQDGTMLAVNNLSASPRDASVRLEAAYSRAEDLIGGGGFDLDDGILGLRLGPYEVRWLRLASPARSDAPDGSPRPSEREAMPELPASEPSHETAPPRATIATRPSTRGRAGDSARRRAVPG